MTDQSFIWQAKESTSLRCKGRLTPKERLNLGSSFIYVFFFFSPPPGPALCKLGQPGGLFVSPEVLTQVLGFSFFPFSHFFFFLSLSFSYCHLGLLFPIQVQSLVWEDPLEKGKATHTSILAWRTPWTVESMGSQKVGHD